MKRVATQRDFVWRDGAGRELIAKMGKEAQPDTVASRLLWAVGYLHRYYLLGSHSRDSG